MEIKQYNDLSPSKWDRLSNTDLGATMIKNSLHFDFWATNNSTLANQRYKEISDWLEKNTQGLYYWEQNPAGQILYFEIAEDAVAFKLQFSGHQFQDGLPTIK